MVKPNKEFRSDLAKEMREKYNERNEQLEQIGKSPYSEGLKEQMRKEVMENFYVEMDEMKIRPGYEEAKKTQLEEIKAKMKLDKSKKEKESLQKEYKEKLAQADIEVSENQKSYEYAQEIHRGTVKDKQNITEKLKGNTNAILDDLKKNHVKIEEKAEMMRFDGKIVHIDLPAVGNFKGFKFDYFESGVRVDKEYFEKKKLFERESEIEKKSFSVKDISELLQAINDYMAEFQCENDGDMDYEHELINWRKNKKEICIAGFYLGTIIGSNLCWLSDKNIDGKKDSRVYRFCEATPRRCYFNYGDNDNMKNLEAHVLLKLPDKK